MLVGEKASLEVILKENPGRGLKKSTIPYPDMMFVSSPLLLLSFSLVGGRALGGFGWDGILFFTIVSYFFFLSCLFFFTFTRFLFSLSHFVSSVFFLRRNGLQ